MFRDNRLLSRVAALALLFLVVTLVVVGVAKPLLDQRQGYRDSIERSSRLVAEYRKRAVRRPELVARLERLERQRHTTGAFHVAESATLAAAGIQGRLRRLVQNSGGKLTSTQFLPADKSELFERVTVRARMSASIEALQKIFYELESGKPYLFIDNISISARASLRPGQKRNRRARRTRKEFGAMINVRYDVYGYLWGEGPR